MFLSDLKSCNGSCTPPQIITFNTPFSNVENISNLIILNQNLNRVSIDFDEFEKISLKSQVYYSEDELSFAYSMDGTCWSCYMDVDSVFKSLSNSTSDFFLRIKVNGPVVGIFQKDFSSGSLNIYNDWSISLMSGFNFSYTCTSSNSNLYNPYANMDCAIQLQTQLAETVSCMFGIQAYYFQVNGVNSSTDVTFKEYALYNVASVKQIKLMITDGAMPSSRPEFSDLGLDFQTDWEVEITKGTFATAFGTTAQPSEGDFVYIPMMKRMWSVSGVWEEKNQSLMWVGTSFKLTLVKYQDDASVNKENVATIVNDIVKTKYEDLFGDEEGLDSGIESAQLIQQTSSNLSPVFESDSCRRSASNFVLNCVKNANTNNSSNANNTLYYQGTQICDSFYDMTQVDSSLVMSKENSTGLIYQRQFCGSEFSLSFLINVSNYNETFSDQLEVISIGHISIILEKQKNNNLYIIKTKNLKVEIEPNSWYFIVLRGSKTMNTSNLICAKYKYPDNLPIYKLQKYHYYFDIDGAEAVSSTFSIEFDVDTKSEVKVSHFPGCLSNVKLLNIYNDNLSELLMQNPTNQHLLINDTALPFLGLNGVNQY
jgi:hypothetical protein